MKNLVFASQTVTFMDREWSLMTKLVASARSSFHPTRIPPLVLVAGNNWNPASLRPRISAAV
jgi:hypothetical protein